MQRQQSSEKCCHWRFQPDSSISCASLPKNDFYAREIFASYYALLSSSVSQHSRVYWENLHCLFYAHFHRFCAEADQRVRKSVLWTIEKAGRRQARRHSTNAFDQALAHSYRSNLLYDKTKHWKLMLERTVGHVNAFSTCANKRLHASLKQEMYESGKRGAYPAPNATLQWSSSTAGVS